MKIPFSILFSLSIVFPWSSGNAAHPKLETLLQRARGYSCLPPVTRGEGPEVWRAIAVFDLDETLVDSSRRMLRAYHRAAGEVCSRGKGLSEEECEVFQSLTLEKFHDRKNRYDFVELLHALGLSYSLPLEFLLHERAVELYLDGSGLELDEPLPGAVELITRLRGRCTAIYFVSSRYEASQGSATRASLVRLGLMREDDPPRVLLRKTDERSLDFKRRAYRQIREIEDQGESRVIGFFENEPENLNALMELFPEALAFFVEGAYLLDEPLKGSPVRLRDFQ